MNTKASKPPRPSPLPDTRHAEHMRNDWDGELLPFLAADELAEVSAQANAATHLLMRQGSRLAALVKTQRLDLFHE